MATPYLSPVSRDRLREVLSYDPATGIFTWKVRIPQSKLEIGTRAGSIYSNGYRYIQIDGVPYRACRLAWLYVKGEPIPKQLDHRSTVKDDDRIENLRAATFSQNQANRGPQTTNRSGIKGVSWETSRNRWVAHIMVHGKAKNLGRFLTKEEAGKAYETAAKAAFGEFARTEK